MANGVGIDSKSFQPYFINLKIENLVLPPGCMPYGQEAGPGFFILSVD